MGDGRKLQDDEPVKELVEKLAEIEHERWAHWQRYMHDHSALLEDGSLHVPADLVQRWETQISTPYGELSEKEKQSDRDQVMRYFPLLNNWLASQR